jgi:hypothetical protein
LSDRGHDAEGDVTIAWNNSLPSNWQSEEANLRTTNLGG